MTYRKLSVEHEKLINQSDLFVKDLLEEGNKCKRQNDLIGEALAHRQAQEILRTKFKLQKWNKDSKLAFAYNSVIIHKAKEVKIGLKMGYTFSEMFVLNKKNFRFNIAKPFSNKIKLIYHAVA